MKRLIPGLVAAGVLSIPLAQANAQLFSDNFDANTSGSWAVNKDADSEVIFNYDYSAVGIPSAPNSTGGSTLGVRFRANIDTTTGAQAINISPIGGNFTGNYRLRYDLWMNVNGPFPGGGAGSTQFFTAGVGNSGAAVQKSSGTANGAWFAVDGEGGSGIDYRAYKGIALEGGTSTAYAAPDSGTINRRDANNPYYHTAFPAGKQAPLWQQTAYPASADAVSNQEGALKAGAIGFAWREVEVTKDGNVVTLDIDGLRIATLTGTTFGGNNIFVGHWDVFASITANPSMNFSVVDNLVVEVVPEPSTVTLGLLGLAGFIFCNRRGKLLS